MYAFVSNNDDFEMTTLFDGKPVKLLKVRGDGNAGFETENDASSSVLNGLKFLEVSLTGVEQERIAKIKSASDKSMDQCFCRVG